MNLDCRCQGRDRNTPCDRWANGEDGLCNDCRLGDGLCCEDMPS